MKVTKILAMILAVVTCVGALTACNNSSSGAGSESTGSTKPGTGSTEGTENTGKQEAVIGFVTEKGNYYLTLNKYTAEGEVSDFAALDITKLTKTEETAEVTVGEKTKYSLVEKGKLTDAAADAVTEGAMIAVTKDEKGVQQIIVLAAPAKLENDLLGKVTFHGGNFLLVNVHTTEEEITDYTTLDTSKLVAGEKEAYVYLPEGVKFQTVTDGALAETEGANLKVDSLIAVTADEDGNVQIIILPAPAENEPDEA